ncbi:DUF350 domain-containing protein [Nisaea sediminum]|uniref:DUF350 domain-containing protein n=1 Tax=Nisaea sediminum TaxID=2775867 RepID=UPI001868FD6D|nr:DUF350 domain-containing protein [Nisaea sediminum]
MSGVLSSLLAGFPYFAAHFGAAVAMLFVGAMIYVRITAHDEMALIRQGNVAAALSLAGAIVGLALPLAFCLAGSVSILDIVIWGSVTLIIQILAFRLVDLAVKNLSERIEQGEIGPAVLLVSVKLSVASLNAAAIAG